VVKICAANNRVMKNQKAASGEKRLAGLAV